MISFVCSQCSRKLRAPDEHAGKKAKCPQCGGVSAIPRLVATTPDGGPVPAQPPPATPDPTLAPNSSPVLVEPRDATEQPSAPTQATATRHDLPPQPRRTVERGP